MSERDMIARKKTRNRHNTKGIEAKVAGHAATIEHVVSAHLAVVHLVLKETAADEDLHQGRSRDLR